MSDACGLAINLGYVLVNYTITSAHARMDAASPAQTYQTQSSDKYANVLPQTIITVKNTYHVRKSSNHYNIKVIYVSVVVCLLYAICVCVETSTDASSATSTTNQPQPTLTIPEVNTSTEGACGESTWVMS